MNAPDAVRFERAEARLSSLEHIAHSPTDVTDRLQAMEDRRDRHSSYIDALQARISALEKSAGGDRVTPSHAAHERRQDARINEGRVRLDRVNQRIDALETEAASDLDELHGLGEKVDSINERLDEEEDSTAGAFNTLNEDIHQHLEDIVKRMLTLRKDVTAMAEAWKVPMGIEV